MDFKKLTIEKIEALELQPGDVLLIKTPRDRTTIKLQKSISDCFSQICGPLRVQTVLYMDEIEKVEILRGLKNGQSKEN